MVCVVRLSWALVEGRHRKSWWWWWRWCQWDIPHTTKCQKDSTTFWVISKYWLIIFRNGNISLKKFLCLQYNQDHDQNLLVIHPPKISSKFVHNFLSYSVNRQTERQSENVTTADLGRGNKQVSYRQQIARQQVTKTWENGPSPMTGVVLGQT